MRILQWIIALLVLCNMGLILTIWLKPTHDDPPPHETPRDYVIRTLKFSAGQVAKYDVLIKDHQHAMHELRDKASKYRTTLFANLKNEQQSSPVTDSLTTLITNVQKQIEMVTYNHFAQVRTICTDAQKTEFDTIIGDVIKKMNGRPPHPPHDGQGPPPHHGPPPPEGH
ncbi:MAG: hypothetical protein K0Q79_1678 [Flavipsychrobacter sp.]|nr:hypothetical protein [Flavipsychrobacter sp.]